MTTTIQIEHQAESHRAHISQLLDELRERATPGEVLDQLLGWEDGREIARTFGRQVRNNPLPLALIGTGIAWLMAGDAIRARRPAVVYTERTPGRMTSGLADSGRHAADAVRGAAGSAQDAARDASDWTRDTAANVTDTAQSAFGSARSTASDLADGAQSAMGRARQTVSETAESVSDTAQSAWQKTSGAAQSAAEKARQTGSNITSVARDQPLLVAGIGMALGMALGALLPASDTENEMFGDEADALKSKAGDLVQHGYGQAKAVVQKSYEAAANAANDEMEKPGSGPGHNSEVDMPPETVRSGDGYGGGRGSSTYPHH